MLFCKWWSCCLFTLFVGSLVLSQDTEIKVSLGTESVEVNCFESSKAMQDGSDYTVQVYLQTFKKTEFFFENKTFYIAQFSPKNNMLDYKIDHFKDTLDFSLTGKLIINGSIVLQDIGIKVVRCKIVSNRFPITNLTTTIEVYIPKAENSSESGNGTKADDGNIILAIFKKNIVIAIQSALLFIVIVIAVICCHLNNRSSVRDHVEETFVGLHHDSYPPRSC